MEKLPFASRENVMLVDGLLIRDFLDTDFTNIHEHSIDVNDFAPQFYIPKNEIWLDHRYADEVDFLLATERIIGSIETQSRAAILEQLRSIGFLKEGAPPDFIERTEMNDNIRTRFVNGQIVREYLDPQFVLGGHDLAYNYIPAHEVWLDTKMDQREIPMILTHELVEREQMTKGIIYDIAHEYATVAERILRRENGGSFPGDLGYPFNHLSPQEIIKKFYVAGQLPKKRPVAVEHFMQSISMCGPASLKIALSAFRKNFTEEDLAKLADASIQHGTEHEGLVRAAQHLGAIVVEKEGGTLEEIAQLVKSGVPVIVGWFAEDGDHYSVVVDVTPEYLIISDPHWDMPERFIDREHFENVWFDFVGSENRITSWKWYMAIRF